MSHPQDGPSNRLSRETSPYLLQHARNPVDWYPWGEEAFALARAENRPIFLSVGYSACHWCHVMERESFEDAEIAHLMNTMFVNIKVDREERPEIDQIYMAAVQSMSGRGGWPMSVFLTPNGQPFFGGTYFPPSDRHGMAGFPRVLQAVHDAWRQRRQEVLESAEELTRQIRELSQLPRTNGALTFDLLDQATRQLSSSFDGSHGGFGSAPKFLHTMDIRLLLRQFQRTGDQHALTMASHTLRKMADGGIHDHLAGGFARYSTDARWLVPHFEKMLYDNALLAGAYLEAAQVTGDPFFREVARSTLDYVLQRMTSPEGGFYSAEDADSEGVEGKYYVWRLAEIEQLLGAEKARRFAAAFDVTEHGNWEESNILHRPRPLAAIAAGFQLDEDSLRAELDESRLILLAHRETRVPPGKDTKILTSWNGLMIGPLAEAGWILDEPRYLDAARNAARFLLDQMRTSDGHLLHSFKDGQARFQGCLDDYAFLMDGLIRLFTCVGEEVWLTAALRLAEILEDEFLDPSSGDFFYTSKDHEPLIARLKETHDNATPSGTFLAATALIRLSALTGSARWAERAEQALSASLTVLQRLPAAAAQGLIGVDLLLSPVQQIVVVAGTDEDEYRNVMIALHSQFLPRAVIAPSPADADADPSWSRSTPLFDQRPAIDGRATVYVCEQSVCQPPVVGLEAATELAGRLATLAD